MFHAMKREIVKMYGQVIRNLPEGQMNILNVFVRRKYGNRKKTS